MDVNFTAELGGMELDQLLAHQQELTRQRKAVLARQADVQAELDRRAEAIAARRATEDQLLGASAKPPTQHLLGTPEPTEAGS